LWNKTYTNDTCLKNLCVFPQAGRKIDEVDPLLRLALQQYEKEMLENDNKFVDALKLHNTSPGQVLFANEFEHEFYCLLTNAKQEFSLLNLLHVSIYLLQFFFIHIFCLVSSERNHYFFLVQVAQESSKFSMCGLTKER
jgi:hypothetical protein